MQTRPNISEVTDKQHDYLLPNPPPAREGQPKGVIPQPSLLHPLARRRLRQLESARHTHNQRLAQRLHDIFVGRGLTHADFSIGGGRSLFVPRVLSVVPGPPVGLNVRMLPGQIPDDFVAQAKAIAYGLDVPEVQIVPLGPSVIRVELLGNGRLN
jgi:hypothetical protein